MFFVINGRSRACEMKDIIQLALYANKFRHIVVNKSEAWVKPELPDIFLVSGDKVVHGNDGISLVEEMLAKMAADKSRAARDQEALHGRPTARYVNPRARILAGS